MARETVTIFGKEACPYTAAARDDYARRGAIIEYFDVRADASAMARMLDVSGGVREVPVIVDGGKVTIGYGGT